MASPKTTRKTLIAGIRQGDMAAWEEFYTGYKVMVFSLARTHGLSDRDTEDLTHDVFTGLLGNTAEGRTRFRFDPDGTAKFRTWFRRVIRNKLCDHFRKKRPERPAADAQFVGNDADTQQAPDQQLVALDRDRFAREFERHWRFIVLQQALARLKGEVEPQTYQALLLSKWEGHDVEAVARQFGRRRNAIDQANHRCLRRLREIVADLETERNGRSTPAPVSGVARKRRKKSGKPSEEE